MFQANGGGAVSEMTPIECPVPLCSWLAYPPRVDYFMNAHLENHHPLYSWFKNLRKPIKIKQSAEIERELAEDLERAESFDWDKGSKDALISMNKGLLALLRAERYAVYVREIKLEAILQMPEKAPCYVDGCENKYEAGEISGYNQHRAEVREIANKEVKP